MAFTTSVSAWIATKQHKPQHLSGYQQHLDDTSGLCNKHVWNGCKVFTNQIRTAICMLPDVESYKLVLESDSHHKNTEQHSV